MLSERELHSRYEVMVEQYVTKLNIESETAFTIAKTMLVPAAVRYLGELGLAGDGAGVTALAARGVGPARRVRRADRRARGGQRPATRRPTTRSRRRATSRSTIVPAMEAVREVADELEGVVPDSLWPLPKYEEILFVK